MSDPTPIERAARDTVQMPPEFTAGNCELVAGMVQYRIDRCIEINGSREAAVKAGGMGFGMYHMEQIVHALTKAAEEIRALVAARDEAKADASEFASRLQHASAHIAGIEDGAAMLRAEISAISEPTPAMAEAARDTFFILSGRKVQPELMRAAITAAMRVAREGV